MAAYGLGATRWETIMAVVVPTAARGIFGGVVLAFGRPLGETMALAMLVGNSNQIGVSLFSPATVTGMTLVSLPIWATRPCRPASFSARWPLSRPCVRAAFPIPARYVQPESALVTRDWPGRAARS